MVRRRRVEDPQGAGIPNDVTTFNPARWPGNSEYQRWDVWNQARRSWAEENLPEGVEDLPEWDGVIPDQPWDEVEL